jgi:putative sterol carrier protein
LRAVDAQVAIGLELWQGVVALCFEEMPRYYTGGPAAVVEWRLSGPGGGRWQLVLDGERCVVVRDGRRDPDVSFEAEDRDFVAVCLGQADPRRLALRGRIRPRGNLLLAARAAGWFATPAAG